MSIRVKAATRSQLDVCRCDVCSEPVKARGWINPTLARLIRDSTGSYVHGKCLNIDSSKGA